MKAVASFSSSAVSRDEVRRIIADYVALDRARTLRRARVTRFGLLAAIAMILEAVTNVLSTVQQCVGICLLIMPIAQAWLRENRLEAQLERRLDNANRLSDVMSSRKSHTSA